MSPIQRVDWRALGAALFLAIGLASVPILALAQDESSSPPTEPDTSAAARKASRAESYPNMFQGEFSPAKGFDLVKTEKGTLNISFYGMFRYINQNPATQTFTDHLGNVRDGEVAERSQLAAFVHLADRLVLRAPVSLQRQRLVTGRDAADAGVRQPAVPAESPLQFWRWSGAEPDRAVHAGHLAILGRKRPPDERGVLPRRILVRGLDVGRNRAALELQHLGQHQHQPVGRDGHQ